jgi:hypothetical protein
MNVYTGKRGMKYIRPSPRMGVNVKHLFQYYNQCWNMSLMPLVQRTINGMTNEAIKLKKMINPFYEGVIDLHSQYDEKAEQSKY